MSSFDLRDALEGIKDIANLEIANGHDVSSMSLREVDDILSRAVDSVSHDFSNVTEDDILDIYRSVLKAVVISPQTISPALMTKILDSIASAFTAAADDTSRNVDSLGPDELRERRQILETYAFLLTWFVLGAEKYKGTGTADGASAAPKPRRGRGAKTAAGGRAKKTAEWTWVEQIEPTLGLIVKVLKIRSQRIWTTTVDRETVLEALMGPVYRVMENEAYMKFEGIRANVYQAICLAVKHHNHSKSAQDKLIQILGYSDGLADQVADLLAALAKDYDHTALTEEFLREVADKTWASSDSTGPKSFSRCLIRLGEVAPRLVLKELGALQNHLDNDSYQMRNAIVEIFGALIRDQISQRETAEDKEHVDNTIDNLYEELLRRLLDTSSYVRSRVFQVLIKVLETDGNGRYGKWRMKVTMKCGHALMDKTATVRKYALVCLQTLLQTHTVESVKDGKKFTDLPREHYEEQYEQFCADEKAHKAELVAISKENAPDGQAQPEAEQAQEAAQQEAKTPKKKRSKKRRSEDDDGMDVDGEDGEAEGADDDDDADSIISGDGEHRPKSKEAADEDLTTLNLTGLTEAQQARANLEIERIELAQKYKKIYAASLQFIGAIEMAMETACTLLGSKHKAEVLEAMELFGVAYMYKMSTAEEGMRKMIHLIWQKDNNAPPTTTGEEVVSTKGVRTRLIATYESIYFRPQKLVEQRKVAKEIAKQLIVLTYSMSLAELTSLEELLRQMMDEDRVHADIIETLWLVYEDKRALPAVQRRGAIILLGMFALSKPSVVREKQSILLEIGLGKHGKASADLQLAKYTCIALQRMTGMKKKIKGSLEDNRQRYAMSNAVFRRIIDVLEASTHDRAWFAFAEQALNAVYALAEKPEVVAERVIRDLTRRAFTSAPMPATGQDGSASPPQPHPEQEKEREERDPDAMETDDEEETIKAKAQEGGEEGEEDRAATPQPQAAPGPSQASAVPGGDAGDAFGLSQMFFVVGHVAMKQIVHLELIEREMKRKKHEQEMAAKQGATQTEKEDEIEQVAGNAEDDIGELIKHVREEELLFGERSLLNVYGPLLVYVCGSPQIYKDATLRSAATLSFAKFLCVSGKFCEEHHMLLFKILETSRDPNIRANIVIGIGDLAVSFATIIDERLNDLYMGLGADELIVKKNTLMVLTHLILNGMIKVKGQLAEMAKCIEDGEERVSD
ncbi:ARM repeat-containing protein, partial [Peniophora sp. CONT]